jgi:hypothetical protein
MLALLHREFYLTRLCHFAPLRGFLEASRRKLHGRCRRDSARAKKKAAIGFAPMAASKGERG